MNKEDKLVPNSVEEIDNHLEDFFSSDEILVLHEIESEIIHSDIYIIKPNDKIGRDYYILLTCGLSALPMSVPDKDENEEFIELVMLLPKTWILEYKKFEDENNYWPIRLLKELSKLPHKHKTWLGYGHTYGDPSEDAYSVNNKFVGAIITESITLPEEFLTISFKGKTIQLYSVIPLYKEELDYKMKNNTKTLMERFEKYNVDEILNINRVNTCE